jgi:HEAT repeat protein
MRLAIDSSPDLVPGLHAWLEGTVDWELHRRRGFVYHLFGPHAAIDATEAQAMSYLVELGQPVAARLAGGLANGNARIRERVAMTLGLIGGEQALSALEPARRDPDMNVARASERAIARIRIGQR